MAPAFRSRERNATKDDVCALRRSVPFFQQSGLERAAERIGIGQIASSRQRHSLDPASLRSRGMSAREAVQGKCGAMPLTVFGVRSAEAREFVVDLLVSREFGYSFAEAMQIWGKNISALAYFDKSLKV
ncbi:MAG: hypothetical protein KF794_11995 [Xanthobacteraceae bacterium]|nr:hypothetical protein [Xanthobacteraceae bacterium]QYK44485.1 MAG: hypothetical protein KF794_11995 [Xanthobacteraceae bacterium]